MNYKWYVQIILGEEFILHNNYTYMLGNNYILWGKSKVFNVYIMGGLLKYLQKKSLKLEKINLLKRQMYVLNARTVKTQVTAWIPGLTSVSTVRLYAMQT